MGGGGGGIVFGMIMLEENRNARILTFEPVFDKEKKTSTTSAVSFCPDIMLSTIFFFFSFGACSSFPPQDSTALMTDTRSTLIIHSSMEGIGRVHYYTKYIQKQLRLYLPTVTNVLYVCRE